MKARLIIVVIGLLCLPRSPSVEAQLYNDGGVHDIPGGSYDRIEVDNPPPPPPAFTTVNLGMTEYTFVSWLEVFNSGRVNVDRFGPYHGEDAEVWHLLAHQNSQVAVNGGTVFDLATYDNSRATINSAQVDFVSAHDNSQVTVNDGGMLISLSAHDNSQLTVNPGFYFEDIGSILAYENSRVTITGVSSVSYGEAGGNSHVTIDSSTFETFRALADSTVLVKNGFFDTFDALGSSRVTLDGAWVGFDFFAEDNSQVTINGAEFVFFFDAGGNSQVTVNGGQFLHGISTSDQGLLTLVGHDFRVYSDAAFTDLVFSGYGHLAGAVGPYWLWGTLANGDRLEGVLTEVFGNSEISFVPLPGAVLLGVLGLGLAGWRLRRTTG